MESAVESERKKIITVAAKKTVNGGLLPDLWEVVFTEI